MQAKANTIDEYMSQLPAERQVVMQHLRDVIKENLPKGFVECLSYGMIGYVVPHSLYPAGYHCDPKLPLPFMSIASQKNFVAVYHMGIYASEPMMNWFLEEYPKQCSLKLDMGKSCIRFKKIEQIPYPLIGDLAGKMTPADWISLYEKAFRS